MKLCRPMSLHVDQADQSQLSDVTVVFQLSSFVGRRYFIFRSQRSTTQIRPIVTDGVVWSVRLSVTIVSTAKSAEPIEMPFGKWTRVGPRKRVGLLHRGAHWFHLRRIQLNRPCAAAMQFYVKLL